MRSSVRPVVVLSLLAACADENPFVSDPRDWALDPITVRPTTVIGSRLVEDSSDVWAWLVLLTAVNPEAAADTIRYGPCSFGVVLYDAPDRAQPVWDNAPRAGTPCPEVLLSLEVPAGGAAGVTVSRLARGMALPSGTHWSGLAYRIGDATHVAAGDSLTLP